MSTKKSPLGTPIDILTAALTRERDAYRFYDQLLNTTTVSMLQELLEKLRDEEHKHILMIEQKISKLRGVS